MANIRSNIMVCGGTGCVASRSDEIIANLKEEVKKAGYENEIEVVKTGCFGFCGQGPIVKFHPDNVFYVGVQPEDAKELVEEHVVKGLVVERLLFNEPTSEEKIREINSDISYREDEHSVNSGLNLLFSLFDTAIDLSDDEDNNLGEVLENVAIYSSNQINENISYDEDMDYLESQKYFWKNKVLRITELDKDEEIDGMFFTPILTEAKYIKLFIPLGKTIHTYKFKQTLE